MLTEQDLQELLYNPSPGAVNSDVDVSKRLYVKEKIEERRRELKETARQHADFFREELSKIDRQEDFLDAQIIDYLRNTGRKNVKVPIATVGVSTHRRVTWPSDEVLLDFVRTAIGEDAVAIGAVQVTEKPSKAYLKVFIEDYGQAPEGYVVTEEDSLFVRRRKEEEVEADGESDHRI